MALLMRFAYLPKGTLGRLYDDNNEFICYLLECPWFNNERSVSCIPEGEYDLLPDEEGRYIGHPELQNVPGRSEIIVHPANFVREIEGCLAPGLGFKINDNEPSVTNSRDAYAQLVAKLGTTFKLTIEATTATLRD